MLGLTSKATSSRCFSTIQPRVFSNAVFMPEIFPARLTIPTSKEGVTYDFTCENTATVGEFRQTVLDNTEEDVSSFDLLTADASKADELDKMTLGELKSKKFRMRVNNRTYDVYPDLLSITRSQADAKANAKIKKEVAKLDNLENSIAISRSVMLRDFYPILVANMKKEATTGGKITKDKLDKAIKASLKTYADTLSAESTKSQAVLDELKLELEV